MNPYESDKQLAEYLLFHFATPEEVLPWPDGPTAALDYPVRCVRECVDLGALPPTARALDIGCAVGRSAFELANHCAEVIGIDYSQRFIQMAQALVRDGCVPFLRADEGALTTPLVAKVPAEIVRTRVQFEHGDAQALRESLGAFDVVLGANLIDRLADPSQFLARLPRLVKPGGQLVLTSPYTWLPDYTPQEKWLGGFPDNGNQRTTLDGLRSALDKDFSLIATKNLPFLIREHARKFQWSVAEASIWRRN